MSDEIKKEADQAEELSDEELDEVAGGALRKGDIICTTDLKTEAVVEQTTTDTLLRR